MNSFSTLLAELKAKGYRLEEARAKVAHDAVLYALYKSGYKNKTTIKGGVVMCELTQEVRRTTMDIDIGVMHLSISETSIRRMITRWARLTGFQIKIFGTIQELRQDDYRGKRIYLDISDGTIKHPVRTKIDISVQTHDTILQEERQFEILASEKKAALFANSKEQIFVEKLLSLIKHGIMSTRTKDIFDMYFLKDSLNPQTLEHCISTLILQNKKCPLKSPDEILDVLRRTFQSRRILRDMSAPKSNWLKLKPSVVIDELMNFLTNAFKASLKSN